MQKLFGLIFLYLTALSGGAQSVQKVTATELVHFATNQTAFANLKTKELIIRVYKVDRGVSPYAVDTDEVDHYLYIAVSAFGERPRMNLFKAGPFFYPAFLDWTSDKKTGNSLLAFTYRTSKKQQGLLQIDLTRVIFSSDSTTRSARKTK